MLHNLCWWSHTLVIYSNAFFMAYSWLLGFRLMFTTIHCKIKHMSVTVSCYSLWGKYSSCSFKWLPVMMNSFLWSNDLMKSDLLRKCQKCQIHWRNQNLDPSFSLLFFFLFCFLADICHCPHESGKTNASNSQNYTKFINFATILLNWLFSWSIFHFLVHYSSLEKHSSCVEELWKQ